MAGAEIAYIDDSYDDRVFVMSALVIPTYAWREGCRRLRCHRKHLKATYGIFTGTELRAVEFVAGRGRIAPAAVPKKLRAHLFRQTLGVVASLPGAALINGVWPKAGLSVHDVHAKAFARIQERLQRRSVSQQSQMLVVVDERKEGELRTVARRSKIWNPVGSQYGAWEDGGAYKNIPNDRLIEDPIFKPSQQSYFLQAVDFVGFALLKSEVRPTPAIAACGLQGAFDDLRPICVKAASSRDPRGLGIVRT